MKNEILNNLVHSRPDSTASDWLREQAQWMARFAGIDLRITWELDWLSVVSAWAFDGRATTFKLACSYAKQRGLKHIVETGCYRGVPGDGNSTLILAWLARRLKGSFISVDNCSVHCGAATVYLSTMLPEDARASAFWNIVTADSVKFLQDTQEAIDLLYLDSMDIAEDPLPCQNHQLEEIKAAYSKLSSSALVLLDDHGPTGKTALSVPFLLENGWKCICESPQQGLYSR